MNIAECPTCHAYFTHNYIVLSLPIPVLKYLKNYITNTPDPNRKPLFEVRYALFRDPRPH